MYFEDFELGYTVDVPPATITKEAITDFAEKYDYIPLHTDEDYAKASPFGGLIAPGVLSFMAVWAKYLEIDLCGKELLAGKSTKIEWTKPVYPEDVLSSTCTVTALEKRNEKNGIVTLSFRVFNQKNELVLTNVTEAIVKCHKTA